MLPREMIPSFWMYSFYGRKIAQQAETRALSLKAIEYQPLIGSDCIKFQYVERSDAIPDPNRSIVFGCLQQRAKGNSDSTIS